MKPTNLIIIFGTLIILGIIYLIYQQNKKEKIKQAAVNSGIPLSIATAASQSSDPNRSFRSLGVPPEVANLLSSGIPVGKEIYKCTHTDSKGNQTTYDGPCTSVDANNGWVTSSK